jgi:dihydroflavonol-4-reductase
VSERVFVTGASGFVGGAVVRRLVADGRNVAALARTAAAGSAIEAMGAVAVRGDVRDRRALSDAMRGAGVVFHAAGVNAMCLADPRPMIRVNVEGSRNVVAVAAELGARRVVYTSSAATLGERAGEIGSETTTPRGWFLSDYERSKTMAEHAVRADAERLGVELVCVNPASVQGPGRAGGSARLLLDYLNGRLPVAVDTRVSLVDIDDCARGHVLAEERGIPGERYVLCGGTLTVREAVQMLERLTGVRRRVRMLPGAAARVAGAIVETVGRLGGRPTPLCREAVRTLLHGHAYDGSRATRDLDLRYTPVEETFRRTISWFETQGLLASRGAPAAPGAGVPERDNGAGA